MAIGTVLLAGFLAGCSFGVPKDLKPVSRLLTISMHEKGMDDNSPILIRIFKEESHLEVWKQTRSGQYALLKTYDICSWSGELGPKKAEGDKQAPEGFYNVTPAQMNPDSSYYLSFNIGYPNIFDQAHGRTGANLMVHGACSSAGCYSMTDESAGEIFALARDAFRGGQRNFQIQAFPFRMTPENMAKHHANPNMDFWRMLKVGYDSFELTRVPPTVDVCEKQYVFAADAKGARFDPKGRCPEYVIPEPLGTALAQKQAADDLKFATMVVALKNGAGTGGPLVAASRPVPAILERIGIGGAPAPAATPVVTPATTGSIATTSVATTAPVAATPIPMPKPAPVSTTPVAAAPATPVPTLKPTQPAVVAPPGGGTIVNRKFWWDETPVPGKGGA